MNLLTFCGRGGNVPSRFDGQMTDCVRQAAGKVLAARLGKPHTQGAKAGVSVLLLPATAATV